MPSMPISCAFHYDSAHFLTTVPDGHKCGRLHGHTYTLTVTVEGPITDQGWVMDFADIKREVQPWLDHLDHRLLNDEIANPTVELQLVWWWQRLKSRLPLLHELQLREGVGNTAVYRGS